MRIELWQTIRNNIKLPESITEELAEEVGIHIGDGNLHVSIDKKGGKGYRYRIDGNLTDETLYHDGFIKPLMKSLYNCGGYQFINRERNSIQSNFRSKLIFYYKNKILGLPIGLKSNIEIPKPIFQDNEFGDFQVKYFTFLFEIEIKAPAEDNHDERQSHSPQDLQDSVYELVFHIFNQTAFLQLIEIIGLLMEPVLHHSITPSRA